MFGFLERCTVKQFLMTSGITIFMLSAISLLAKRGFTSMAEPGVYSIAYVTVPTENDAKKIAHGLVSNKLAACVNIIPKLISVYEWEGKINEDPELLLMIKTRTSKVSNLTKFVVDNHPYKVCEVITTPIQDGNPAYLKWLSEVIPK